MPIEITAGPTYSSPVSLAYFAAFATAVCYGVSAVLEDRAAKLTPITGYSGKRAAFQATVSIGYIVGMAFSVVAWAFSLIALHRLPLFAVQAMAGSSIGVVVLITWGITRRKPPRREVILLCARRCPDCLGGIGCAQRSQVDLVGVQAVHLGRRHRVGSAAVGATKVSGARGSALLGAVSGLSDGGMALCARALHHHTVFGLVTDPLAIALIPFTVIGIVAFAASLQRGAVAIALACQQATLTVIPSVIGLLVLGDRARHGFVAVTYAGFAVTVFAVLALTVDTSATIPPLVAPGALPPTPLNEIS